jgi:hypothetical protein
MIGGCSAAGSLATMLVVTPADLFAFEGLNGVLNWTPTAEYAVDATSASNPTTALRTISFLRNLTPPRLRAQ